jgi:hypothetical protein
MRGYRSSSHEQPNGRHGRKSRTNMPPNLSTMNRSMWLALFLASAAAVWWLGFRPATAPAGSNAVAGEQGHAIALRLIDRSGRPRPDALAWVLPEAALRAGNWLPCELSAWGCNEHEVVRRMGTPVSPDRSGVLHVPPGSAIAALASPCSAFKVIAAGAAAASDLLLDEARWTIRVRDAAGRRMAGVPIGFRPVPRPENGGHFEGLPIGLTDAAGDLVVFAPNDIDFARYLPQVLGEPTPTPPTAVEFEVEGMYLAPHADRLALPAHGHQQLTLTSPALVRLAITAPEWKGALGDTFEVERIGKAMEWDQTTSWTSQGLHFALVGAPQTQQSLPILVRLAGTTLTTEVELGAGNAGEDVPVRLAIAADDIVLRGRLQDPTGAPLHYAEVFVRPTDAVRTWCVLTDAQGNFTLILRGDVPGPLNLNLQVNSARDPAQAGERATITLTSPQRSDRRDLGNVVASPP